MVSCLGILPRTEGLRPWLRLTPPPDLDHETLFSTLIFQSLWLLQVCWTFSGQLETTRPGPGAT